MRRACFSPSRLAALGTVLMVSSCFSLPKATAIRVIDDFAEDADLSPTWSVFDTWTCGRHIELGPSGDAGGVGADGGLGGGTDAGESVACTLTLGPGDSDDPPFDGAAPQGLLANFNLAAPAEVEVAAPTKSGPPGAADALPTNMPVNLTGFSQLIFDATLVGATLPTGTQLWVELACASLRVKQPSGVMQGVTSWQKIPLLLSGFTPTADRPSCLASVDRISFYVVLGSVRDGTEIAGTLQLDNIRLQ
jgi:hypothetical protein